MKSNPYEVLGLEPGASADALKRCYRKCLQKVHPDLNPGDPDSDKKTQRIIEAYEFLSDPGKRAALDKRLREKEVPPARPPRQTSPHRKAPKAEPKGQTPPRRNQNRRTTQRAQSQSTVIVNGQRIHVSGSGSVNVVVNRSGVHVNAQTHAAQRENLGDLTMGDGTMSGLVMGDLHIRAGAFVKLNGKVMGDVFAGAGSQLTISGKVLGDIHAKGSQVRVVGTVMGDLFVEPGAAEILGVHMGDVL